MAVPQAWAPFCHLSNTTQFSLCHITSPNHVNRDSIFSLWLPAFAIDPCLQYAVVTTIHLIFLFSLIIATSWKKAKKRKRLRPNDSISAQYLRVGKLYRSILGANILLCLIHSVVPIWGVIYGSRNGWFRIVFLESAGIIQLISWFAVVAATAGAKRERSEKFPWLLRAWWILSFCVATTTCISRIVLLRSHLNVQIETWVDIFALPICMFLFIVAIYGRTGLSTPALDAMQEPLLAIGSSDKPTRSEKSSSYATAGFFSLATFSWLDSLLALGYRKALQLDDIPQLAQIDRADSQFGVFKANWDNAEAKNLVKCLFLSFWKGAAVNACFAGLYSCTSFVGPYLIDDFVEYLGGRRRFANEGYVLTGIFVAAKLVQSMSQRHWFFGAQRLGMQATAAVTALIYRKGLCLSNQSRQKHTSGEIINYISVDVQRISDFAWYLHEMWLLPLQVSLALAILYKNLGIAALSTLAATVITMLANIPLSTVQEKFQDKIMTAKDARMKATSEVLRSMRILKLQAWEMRFCKKLEDLRKVECGWLRNFLYAQSAVVAIFWCTPALVAVVTFSTCILMGIPLTAGRVLSALATFRILQEPIYSLPDLVAMLAQTKVALDRVQNFLREQELDLNGMVHLQTNDEAMAVEIQGACFSWDACQESPTLTVSDLQIKKGLKVAVCGLVGSGKSSLISSILGEVPMLSGSIKVSGSRAYVAQSSWIQSGKIQDNILFGKLMDRQKYEDVLQACSLTKDLELFAHGDQTEIGERGINLSGGQKQRIQLARAIYQDADIYLLDDPFSAVDAHTGTHIFKECILQILEGKTVIFVTHQVEFLPAADLILVLDGGKIAQAGKFDDLLESGTNFNKLIGAHNKALESIDVMESSIGSGEDIERTDKIQGDAQVNMQDNRMKQDKDDGDTTDPKSMGQIVQEEERETGKVSMAVYWSLVRAAYGGALVPVILLAQALFQFLQIASNYWMAFATPLSIDQHPIVNNRNLLLVYIGLAVGSAVCILIRTFVLSFIALITAQKFFISMLQCIFRAPMSFFDSTPTGRILNRASTDQSALDLEVCFRLSGVAFNIIQLIGIIAVMSQGALSVFALFVPVMALCLWLQRYYIRSARELARLVGICKSPIIHHFGESISGAATIRAFGQKSRFMDTNLQLIDNYSRPLLSNFASMEWLCLRTTLLGNFVFAFSLLLVVCLPEGTVDPSIAGLAVTYGLNLSMLQDMFAWNLCKIENKIISVERIQQYTRIVSEAPLVIEDSRPPTDWPCEGTISFQNVQVRYAPHMPLVLHGITCTFMGGKKVGVVGRTGSGKSTLIQTLFRVVEPVAGKVSIDDLDISTIGLHDLRSRLSIIPQDPTMFEGTVRSNLDPLEEYTDSEVWKALDKSQLGDIVRSKDEKLDALVSENGENWSAGQRQLVCLGRALLKRTRILLLDEATASVDTATDGVIQDIIRKEFAQCTVITIAHRIPTVIDNDQVLVLSDGRVAEYNSPTRLLQDRSSLFAKLVSEYTTRANSVANNKV